MDPLSAQQGHEDAAGVVVPLLLSRAPRLGRVRVVAVDGPAGSGKTTLAAAVARGCAGAGVRAHVVHMDDLYAGWAGLEGDLWPRLAAQVLEPLRRGVPGRFQRYDWAAGRFGGWVDVPVPGVLVLEGCGSGRLAAAGDLSLLVWVEADDGMRLARGLERDGAQARPHWERWMRDEAAHFAREGTRGRADVRVDAWGRMAR
ncbi:uridine kinase [Cellulomonas sp. ACRRI]|uniref:uridine kinase family protein n=1 Tax=Cellulomonas sp. ACRRI TaxID=2918188 RepID=UPI001EF292E0|nr:uridine kinase [Cellulomonas sp. ACRRI]MCG7286676.1 uridine kinase [Cellulomonas sp. ACRRI]